MTGTTNNGVITLNETAPNGTVEGNLTFDGSVLTVTGGVQVSSTATFSGKLIMATISNSDENTQIITRDSNTGEIEYSNPQSAYIFNYGMSYAMNSSSFMP